MEDIRLRKRRALKVKIVSNLVLGVLILSIGTLCLAPIEEEAVIDLNGAEIYDSAKENGIGVSLMFNVYWGTDEVYQILDILDAHKSKATFFIGGCWADDNVECLKEIHKRGHEIGNHGYFHKDHARLNLIDNQREISSCNRFIELAIGEAPTLFAPPSGAYGNDALESAKSLGMKTILWSKDTIDWRDKNSALIYSRATKKIEVGDFVLMHPQKETVNALDDILKYYETNALKTVTVSENLQIEG